MQFVYRGNFMELIFDEIIIIDELNKKAKNKYSCLE